jgi:type I restriction enzyme M protein
MNKEFQDSAVNCIWKVANILRGPYMEYEYGKVILPFTILRRLDWVLEPTKDALLKAAAKIPEHHSEIMRDAKLKKVTGEQFFNTSQYTFKLLLADPTSIADNLKAYILGFSEEARLIFVKHFAFIEQIDRLDSLNLLYKVVSEFADEKIDLHPDRVSNIDMGGIFEDLIRRFSEQSNATAGEHFTPREVIHLMASLVIAEDRINLTQGRPITRVFDPACGTGGMLTAAEEYLKGINPGIRVDLFGQEVNNESFAICQSDMMVKGQNPSRIKFGNSFTEDHFVHEHFNYMLCNPPYGVDWKQVEKEVRAEFKNKGKKGRFGAGLPRINDGQMLFVQHMLAKFPRDGSIGRIAVIMSGSPLFTGGAESGESAIRQWIIENDWLEAIVALPTEMFYNTGIATFIWILTNKKAPRRKRQVQLIDATGSFVRSDRSLGNKRKKMTPAHITEITRILGDFEAGESSRIFANEHFGYRRITVERPLRLNFSTAADRIERLHTSTEFARLGVADQQRLLAILGELPTEIIRNRDDFLNLLDPALAAAEIKLAAATMKKIVTTLGERDPTADPCTDRKGQPEPDPALRDHESVPLAEDVEAYFKREVLPHLPDAWIDQEKTEIGYEIAFGREFYRYEAPRSLEEIDHELRKAASEIMDMLNEVMA